MTRLLVATTNRGKLAELSAPMVRAGFQVVGLKSFSGVPVAREDGATFAENAQAKALHYARATGLATLADDSGLCVDALGGAPGVHSARFAGPSATDADNRRMLLERMAGIADRRAHFTCALCLAEPVAGGDGRMRLTEVEGHCAGTLLEVERGTHGFGYDSLFVPDDPEADGSTFAQLSEENKLSLSHRGLALRRLAGRLSVRPPEAGRPGGSR